MTHTNSTNQVTSFISPSWFEKLPDALFSTDVHGNFLACNPASVRVTGYPLQELLGMSMTELVAIEQREKLSTYLAKTGQDESHQFTMTIQHKSGQRIDLQITSVLVHDDLENSHITLLAQDITERQRTENQLRAIFESATDAIIVINHNGIILAWNKGAENIFGYKREERIGQKLSLIIPDRLREAHELGMQRYLATGEKKLIDQTIEVTGLHKDGTEIPIELSLATFGDGLETYFTGTIRDISDRKQAEQAMHQMIYYDQLTGLPNRRLFNDTLNQAIAETDETDSLLAILFLDLDHFKVVNDSYGHSVGDELLQKVAQRLKNCVPARATIARIGGDEFTIILSNLKHRSEATLVVERIIHTMTVKPVFLNNRDIFITTSIGVSFYPDDSKDVKSLLRNADVAMYRTKREGRNHYHLYEPELDDSADEAKRMQMERCIRTALEQNEFHLVYQPKIDSQTETIVGVEALLRWDSPELGMIPPSDFIPVAEENGLIIPIGEWILKSACAQYKMWRDAGLRQIGIAINVSVRQLQSPDFVQIVSRILNEANVGGSWLEFEITEGLFMQNSEQIIRILIALKELGIRISIDDFGTGYSSLSYLKQFPIDVLKIDQSFVRDLATDANDVEIAAAIIGLAHSLNYTVIAEGVETEAQKHFLQARQCEQMQGYLFSKPLPVAQIEQLLQER